MPDECIAPRFIGTGVLVAGVLALSARAADLPGETISFNRHVRPIFTKHCMECHGGVKQAAELSFIYPEQVLPPDGSVIEPGKPDESAIIDRVTSADPEYRMPPSDHGPPLAKQEVEVLREWIRQGAVWERAWALEPPRPHGPPTVRNNRWERTSIDRYILTRLEHEGIEPSPDAVPDRWLRRATLDLIGLPPSLAEREAFLADLAVRGEPAYAAVVDRLLASPHFGERWASVWLDQVRYADSRGMGIDSRRNIWKYRDWVIDALNRDLPFNEFTIKQIAGDLLPQPSMDDLVATACQRLTQSNDEGGTDDEEFRVEAVLNRVDTTWLAWQGLTFGCARCHDHPYEPFRHEEYYKFSAFFNNTQDCDLNEEYPLLQVPLDSVKYDAARELDVAINSLQREIWEKEYELVARNDAWRPITELRARTDNDLEARVELKSDQAEYFTVGTVAAATNIILDASLADWPGPLTAIRVTCLPHDPESAARDTEWGFVLSHVSAKLVTRNNAQALELAHVIADEAEPFLDPQESLDPKSNEGFAAYTRINGPRTAVFVLKAPVAVPEGGRLEVTLHHRKQVNSSFSLVARRGHLAVSSDQAFTELLGGEGRASQLSELGRLQKERAAIDSTPVPILRERADAFRRSTHVFARGFFLAKQKAVGADVPASMPSLPTGMPNDRLSMAKWLVSDENPLTARVAVNRFWARLFGTGLVETEEDFGVSGAPPSHPELLDDLALKFQHDFRWSIKMLLRELVLSRTYRQAARRRPELAERDPANRLLAQGPRMRLTAEMVRDQALAISGLLSEKLFGPPAYPPLPEGVWSPFQASDKWETAKPGDPNRYRRSIYTYTKRSIPYPVSAAFDAPSRETCVPRRVRSNTPIQAFMTMNDESFVECSGALATRMERHGGSLRKQLEYGFLLATARQPKPAEIDDLENFVNTLPGDKDAHARLALAASVLLNLDEVITK